MTKPTTYSEKLKDPRWQRARLKTLERDDWTCQLCGDTKATLHVHHRYYESCESCHGEEQECRPSHEASLLLTLRERGPYPDLHFLNELLRDMPADVLRSLTHRSWQSIDGTAYRRLLEWFAEGRAKADAIRERSRQIMRGSEEL